MTDTQKQLLIASAVGLVTIAVGYLLYKPGQIDTAGLNFPPLSIGPTAGTGQTPTITYNIGSNADPNADGGFSFLPATSNPPAVTTSPFAALLTQANLTGNANCCGGGYAPAPLISSTPAPQIPQFDSPEPTATTLQTFQEAPAPHYGTYTDALASAAGFHSSVWGHRQSGIASNAIEGTNNGYIAL